MHFRRLSQDWEMEGVSQYWEFIYTMKVQEEGGGNLVWKENGKGIFNVKLYNSS